MSTRKQTDPIDDELDEEIVPGELEAIVELTRSVLSERQYRKLKFVVAMFVALTAAIAGKNASIKRLKKLLFGPKSESTRKILGDSDSTTDGGENCDGEESAGEDDVDENDAEPSDDRDRKPKKKRKGHGRRGIDEYTGAQRIHVRHESLNSGDPSPCCHGQGGKVYRMKDPASLVKVFGQAALFALIYLLERLRCNICGRIYTAKLPEGVDGDEKYDATAVSMMALLRYGFGLPLNRLEQLQKALGIPLPASTQWETVSRAASVFEPVIEELERQAAQGEVVHNDDTKMVILDLLEENKKKRAQSGEDPGRTGIFTSGIVSINKDRKIALFRTGRKHAGENLNEIASKREPELEPLIQMCDALSRNASPEFKRILCHCMAHARRQYVDVVEDFPDECEFVLKTLREVYKNDAIAREQKMTPEERLAFHRKTSKRLMASLRRWMYKQFKDRLVEPNSGLGQAIQYMRKYWRRLTRFLFVPGAPLDNNIVERALKKAIIHRKNSLFYKTENGARVGDLYMSIIATCQLAGANPFDYLTEIQRNAEAVKQDPASWMPWNYRETLERLKGTGPDPPTSEKASSRSA